MLQCQWLDPHFGRLKNLFCELRSFVGWRAGGRHFAMATGVSSYQIGGRKQYGGKPRSRPTPQSSTRLAMRRQGKLPFKKTKTVTRSVKKPVVDPEKAGCDEEPKCYFAGKKQWVVDHHTNFVKPMLASDNVKKPEFDGPLFLVMDCPQ
ncbi:hypothetical protein TEA_010591 [Camellia sinensis var. sinensis]|uniref:Uncharacterized protein n=1 Tax=Camellia sinensis var. sinensis TaxID=542762 RepID=A0A4S4E3H5_CAMSN|nr:hypothetical protein TEA_010591 [Camellia sinensis var. sinensis]